MGMSSGTYELNHSFYIDSNMTVPLQCVALVYVDRLSSSWLYIGIQIKSLYRRLSN